MPDTKAIIFTGRIYPERTYVGMQGDAPGGALLVNIVPYGGDPLPARVLMDASQVIVALTEPDPLGDLWTLKNDVQSTVSSFADVVGWQNGCGYLAEITSYASSDIQGVFGVQSPGLAAKPSRLDTTTVYSLVVSGNEGTYLRRALADLRWAILSPEDTPFFCFRAVEALSRHFATRKARARALMCASLRMDDRWVVRWLQRPANDIRHGASAFASSEERRRSYSAAHEVIERYMVWRTSGGAGLSDSEFPRLREEDDPLALLA